MSNKKSKKTANKNNMPHRMSDASKKLFWLWGTFALFFVIRIANIMDVWPVLSLWSVCLSIFLLIKNKMPSVKRIIISAVFSLVASCVILFTIYNQNSASQLVSILFILVPTLVSSLAVFSVMEKYGDFVLLKCETKKDIFITAGISVASGIVLGIINCFLRTGNAEINIVFDFSKIILCLNPAIYEEIACRAVFMAFVFYICRGVKLTRFQSFTMWFMMTVPHVICHGYGIVESVVLFVMCGLPFAVLQRKRDIAGSMISHGLVDAIRFIAFGM